MQNFTIRVCFVEGNRNITAATLLGLFLVNLIAYEIPEAAKQECAEFTLLLINIREEMGLVSP